MEIWIVYILICAFFSGFFGVAQKKATNKSSVYEILAGFCTLAFLFVAITTKDAFEIDFTYLPIILLKSLIIVVVWGIGIYVVKKLPVSLYEILKLSTIVFSVILSWIIFKEVITVKILTGIIIVLLGLVLVNLISDNRDNKEVSLKLILIMLVSCFLSAVSAIIDKGILSHITSSQLQFWFMLFLMIAFWVILIIKEKKVNFKNIKNNYWIILIALSITLGDRFLFKANSEPESSVSIIMVLKQLSVIESIILGKIMFNEKNIIKKLMCSLVVIAGIVLIFI